MGYFKERSSFRSGYIHDPNNGFSFNHSSCQEIVPTILNFHENKYKYIYIYIYICSESLGRTYTSLCDSFSSYF